MPASSPSSPQHLFYFLEITLIGQVSDPCVTLSLVISLFYVTVSLLISFFYFSSLTELLLLFSSLSPASWIMRVISGLRKPTRAVNSFLQFFLRFLWYVTSILYHDSSLCLGCHLFFFSLWCKLNMVSLHTTVFLDRKLFLLVTVVNQPLHAGSSKLPLFFSFVPVVFSYFIFFNAHCTFSMNISIVFFSFVISFQDTDDTFC